jgi:hypothetical protein
MSKKMIYLIPFVLVLGLAMSAAEGADASLVGYWRFEEGSGTTAYDSSGYGRDGTLVGGATWAEGRYGGGIELDGTSGYISVPDFELTTDTITFAIWVNGWKGGDWAPLISSRVVGQCEMNFGDNDTLHYTWNNDSSATWGWTGGPVIPQDTWTMLAVTIDPERAIAYVYTDADGLTQTTNAIAHIEETVGALQIGYSYDPRYVRGIIDEAAVYNRALTEVEIRGIVMGIGKGYPYALGPTPKDGALHTDTWVNISWRPGVSAVSHDVYFGDNFNDVNDGAAETFQGNQAATFIVAGFPGFPYPEGLVPGTTYYWRIDEVNDAEPNSPWKGNVWSFSIPPRKAYNPAPADVARYIDLETVLSWDAGFGAKLHTAYFGDNFDDVNNAAGGLPQATTTFTPGTLELEKTYYWRVDEFDAVTTHKGDVWSFKTLPDIPITDPNLVGWWTLDEGMGTTALDWSGYGNHGTLEGDPQWVPGYDGGALEFDGDDYVDTGNTENLANWTITAWVISPEAPSSDSPSGPLHREQNYQFNWNHNNDVYRGATAINVGGTWHAAKYMPLAANTWYHLAASYDGNALKAYRDGVLITSNPAPSGPANAEVNSLKLGRHAAAAQFFTGTVDDARVYDEALTQEEIQQVMRGDTSVAWSPSPGNGSTPDIDEVMPLSWSPGDNASQHDVYFGTDKDAVANTDETDTTGIYRGRQGVTSYNPPEGVEWGGGPYYWRIDEYNTDGTIKKGRIWSFMVNDFLTVDDFEGYDVGNNEIWWVWIDGLGYASHPTLPAHPGNGTGSMVGDETTGSYMEETIVHGGGKSMPVFYDNNQQGKLRYSEVEKTLSSRRDWTAEGVGVLSIWFQGVASNTAETLYVALNGNAVVTHDNPNAAQLDQWTEWTIDLQAFADQGVNLANVNTIAIGLGNKKNPAAGGSGTIYIDDIRLYRPPEPAP